MNEWISTSIISFLQAVCKITLHPQGFSTLFILEDTHIRVYYYVQAAFIPDGLAFIWVD